jgi:hypothetical protein
VEITHSTPGDRNDRTSALITFPGLSPSKLASSDYNAVPPPRSKSGRLGLPLDPDMGKCRILTFGYDASFGFGSSRSANNITDFAKELLYEMAFGRDDEGNDLGIGDVPIIFIAHSM